jgi:iron only hydrogenase large subunit-like protein
MKSIDNSLYTVFLAPCYDKKLEGFKLKFEEKPMMDLVVATDEFFNHGKEIKELQKKTLKIINLEESCRRI